jgi:hypothetical protein
MSEGVSRKRWIRHAAYPDARKIVRFRVIVPAQNEMSPGGTTTKIIHPEVFHSNGR